MRSLPLNYVDGWFSSLYIGVYIVFSFYYMKRYKGVTNSS